jgi:hypothetical protein
MDKVLQYISRALANKEPLMPAFSFFAFWGDPKYQHPAMCHKWGYTIGSLKELLESVGFEDVMFEVPRYHFPMRDMRAVAIKGA